ncbi:bifunctional folylpolyglutamate synthase/dihydrofolate synthase [Jatrophihabitans sp. YIM 134969]
MATAPGGASRADQARAAVARVDEALSHRWGEGRIAPSLDRIRALLDLLGDPQTAYRSIHVTGTNGKTSTARMIDELLRAASLRTGRYTSPHLESTTERIVIDGEPVDGVRLGETYDELAPLIEIVDAQSEVRMTFFEVLTAMAYAIFADTPVEAAVVEVGLGGSWDATNVIDGDVAVVTPIGLDHTEYLGPDVATIAAEKAGIIKPGATAILAIQDNAAAEVLIRRAVEVEATVAREGMEFGVRERAIAVGGQVLTLQGLGGRYEDVFLPLFGAHQAQNAAVALAAVEAFFGAGAATGPLDVDLVKAAFANVTSPGRLEPVRSSPTVLLDAAHNPHGMAATVAALGESFSFRRLVAVVGILEGKDALGILAALQPVVDELVVTQNSSARAMAADDLAAVAVEVFDTDQVTVEPRLDDALETAIRLAEDIGDVDTIAGSGVLVTGSVVTVGEARTLLGGSRT